MNNTKYQGIHNWKLGIRELQNGNWDVEEISIRGVLELNGIWASFEIYTDQNEKDGIFIIPADNIAAIHREEPTGAKVIKLNSDEGPEDERDILA